MAFPLEALVSVSPDLAGPKIKEYVKAVHDRWVLLIILVSDYEPDHND